MTNQIGITEGADPTVNLKWQEWVNVGKPAILITKRPDLLYPMLTGKENVIIHCTITGMGGSKIEPNIPEYNYELEYYHKFYELFGKDRVVLRIDPIMYPANMKVLKQIISKTIGRVRISFLDLYPHVIKRFKDNGIDIEQLNFHQPLGYRMKIWKQLGKPEICGEPDMPITPCVSIKDCKILHVNPFKVEKHQRFVCHCLANKVELCKEHNCTYGCLYCYWK
jgi:DNA repair photolyase